MYNTILDRAYELKKKFMGTTMVLNLNLVRIYRSESIADGMPV